MCHVLLLPDTKRFKVSRNLSFIINALMCPYRLNKWFGKKLGEFKFNAYIRYYMLSYYDLTFFAVMKLT